MIVKLTKKGIQLQQDSAEMPSTVGGAVLCKSVTPDTDPELYRMLDDMIAQLKNSIKQNTD